MESTSLPYWSNTNAPFTCALAIQIWPYEKGFEAILQEKLSQGHLPSFSLEDAYTAAQRAQWMHDLIIELHTGKGLSQMVSVAQKVAVYAKYPTA